MNTENPLQNAYEYAARKGFTPSDDLRAELARIEQQERTRQAEQNTTAKTPVARFNAFYPRLLESIAGVGDVLITLVQTVLVTFGVPVGLYLFMEVEISRVIHGLQLFEGDLNVARPAATALVLVNVMLEFVAVFAEHRDGYKAPPRQRFSLRIAAGNLSYFLGFGAKWEARTDSPAQWAKSVLRVITWTILTLALFGSMRDVLERVSGNWIEGLRDIVEKSSLLQMATWIVGILFAFAAVLTAQGLARYMAIRCGEILDLMRNRTAGVDAQAERNAAYVAAQHLIAAVNAEQQAKRLAAKTPSVSVLSAQTDSQTSVVHRVSTGLSKPAQALQMLRDNPSLATKTTRELEAETGINKSAWSVALREYANEQPTKPAPAVDIEEVQP